MSTAYKARQRRSVTVSVVTSLLIAETLLLGLLSLLVVALLRAHADVSKRVDELADASKGVGGALSDRIPPPPDRDRGTDAPHVIGETLAGDSIQLDFTAGGPDTLLAFLSSGCMTCRTFWRAFAEEDALPGDARLIVVTKDTSEESPSKLMELAPPGVPVVQSSQTWEEYEVPAAPYFVYVDGPSGKVHGEGAAEQWDQIKSLLTDAILDSQLAAERRPGSTPNGERVSPAAARAARAERALAEAGIPPDHSSLWVPPAEPEGGATEP